MKPADSISGGRSVGSTSLRRPEGGHAARAAISPITTAEDGTAAAVASDGHIVNALSIDVEDYFHADALSERISRSDWQHLPLRVEQSTDRILELLDANKATATFFILGWVAERCPELVRRIADAGHEVGSHGYTHMRVSRQEPEDFSADIARTRRLLEDISGSRVRGYRAASFSLSPDMDWAYRALLETGHLYSSSLHPIHHDAYGAPDASRLPFYPWPEMAIPEIPVSTLDLGGARIPSGGGGYFRLLPYSFTRWAIRRVNSRERRPCVFYVHPWEVDPNQPKVTGLRLRSRVRHYANLSTTRPKLTKLLRDFAWSRIDRVYGAFIAS